MYKRQVLKRVINELKLRLDDNQQMGLLDDCVALEEEDDCRALVENKLRTMMKNTTHHHLNGMV